MVVGEYCLGERYRVTTSTHRET